MGRKLRIAIISDLHCQPSRQESDKEYSNDSYLKSDLLRDSINDHPVESLIYLIKNKHIEEVDFTLCPGDFTDKTNQQGFISGWNYTLEIHRELKSKDVLATLGNHDVDSYGAISNYNIRVAKGIKNGFPLSDDKLCDTFWSKGCAFVEKDDCRFLIINSSHFHQNKVEAGKGRVDDGLLAYVNDYLSNTDDDKIQIAMAHHHPIDHSRLKLGEEDKIVNSDELLKILGENSFDLFVHGHKHDPLLRYYPCTGTNYRLPIFSSGSFSAISNLSWTGQKNTFHRLEIHKDNGNCVCKIKTWTFIPRSGWIVNSDDNGFHPYTGFGYKGTIEELYQKISQEVGNSQIKKWSEIISAIPEVEYLIPTEANELYDLLRRNQLILDKKLSEKPEIISNTKNLL